MKNNCPVPKLGDPEREWAVRENTWTAKLNRKADEFFRSNKHITTCALVLLDTWQCKTKEPILLPPHWIPAFREYFFDRLAYLYRESQYQRFLRGLVYKQRLIQLEMYRAMREQKQE